MSGVADENKLACGVGPAGKRRDGVDGPVGDVGESQREERLDSVAEALG